MSNGGMNPRQEAIATKTEGIMVVDAGPGTGKTHTIINRYINIISKEGVDPRDVLLLTFTHNAAEEMRERIIATIVERGIQGIDVNSVQASTFDSFCFGVLMRDTSSIGSYLGIEERLSRQVRLVENAAMNRRYFKEFYARFLDRHGRSHGDTAQLLWDSPSDVEKVISRLLTLGTCPTASGWFRDGLDILKGDIKGMWERANEANQGEGSELAGILSKAENHRPGSEDAWAGGAVDAESLRKAIEDPRKELFRFIHHVFHEYLRSSIVDNRLTHQMVAFFAFLSLYNDRSVREAETYRYVMVDEFQDTNELQFLISLLILKEDNLCVVGDWKQGIYGFRYADIENIIDFQGRLASLASSLGKRCRAPLCDIDAESLEVNYRSAQRVIGLSEETLFLEAVKDEHLDADEVSQRIVRLKADKHEVDDRDCRVRFLKAPSPKQEVDLILREAQSMVSEGITYSVRRRDGTLERRPVRYSDIAVLSRKRNLLHLLERRARELGIPLLMDGDIDIFRTREGKTALAWLRLINDATDGRAIATIMDTAGYAHDAIAAVCCGRAPLPQRIQDLRARLLEIHRDPNRLLTEVFRLQGMDNDVTQAIISQVSLLYGGTLNSISDIVSLMMENIREGDTYPADMISRRDAIRIQTMHGAKGLEYPAVIVAGLNDKTMPPNYRDGGALRFERLYGLRTVDEITMNGGLLERYRDWRYTLVKALSSREYDEERRLMYVAVSRSMQHLVFTCHEPSIFMKKLAGPNLREVDETSPESLLDVEAVERPPRPVLPSAVVARNTIGVHSVMDLKKEGTGRGKGYGLQIHEDAERIIHGHDAWSNDKSLDRIRDLVRSSAGSRLSPEVDILLPVGDYVLEGRVDLLIEKEDSVEIHDWKTDGDDSNHEEYVLQLSIYAAAASVLGKPVRCHIHYLSQQQTRTEIDVLSREEVERRVLERLDKAR